MNKIDRPDARPHEVLDEILELFLELGADDDLADFPYLFASSRDGYASADETARSGSMKPLLEMIVDKVPGPVVDDEGPLRMLVTTLDWSDYVGRIAVGRIESGKLVKGGGISRRCRVVRKVPERPANGEVLMPKTILKVGSSTARRASGRGLSEQQSVSPISIGSIPLTAAISPAVASSVSTRTSARSTR